MILYHGSKSGIKGCINPNAGRTACDFGSGFYMGDKAEQPKGLIAPYPEHILYELECDFSGLTHKEFSDNYDSQLDWALYIAYNRKILDFSAYHKLEERYRTYNASYDLIVGLIADDKMTQALNRFYEGILCDKGLLEALRHVKLGKQYVMKTQKSCSPSHIRILRSTTLSEKEKKLIIAENTNRITRMQGLLNQIQTKYRRAQDIKFFDEIIEEWNK